LEEDTVKENASKRAKKNLKEGKERMKAATGTAKKRTEQGAVSDPRLLHICS
jgi:hypothetical protein